MKIPTKLVMPEETAIDIMREAIESVRMQIEESKVDGLSPGLLVVSSPETPDEKFYTLSQDLSGKDEEEVLRLGEIALMGFANAGVKAEIIMFGALGEIEVFEKDGSDAMRQGFILHGVTIDGRVFVGFLQIKIRFDGTPLEIENDGIIEVELITRPTFLSEWMTKMHRMYVLRYYLQREERKKGVYQKLN